MDKCIRLKKLLVTVLPSPNFTFMTHSQQTSLEIRVSYNEVYSVKFFIEIVYQEAHLPRTFLL